MESRFLDNQSKMEHLQSTLDEHIREISRLKSVIAASDELIYHAIREDAVDRKLAEYINCAPMRVRFRIMRLERESEGVYKYGMKRVFIKIENDQIVIRVGGGFMNIEEFVDQYCNPPFMNTSSAPQEESPRGGDGSAQ